MVAQAAREKEKAQEKAAARRADAERRIQEIWEAEERRAEEDYQERKAAGDAARVESHAERERREEELAQKMWEAEQEAMKPSPKKAKHQPKPATPPAAAEGEAAEPAPAPAPAPFPAPLSGEYSRDDGIRVQSVVTTEERREAQAETLKVQQEQRVKDLRKGKVDEESLASKKQALVNRLEAELQRKVGGKGFVSRPPSRHILPNCLRLMGSWLASGCGAACVWRGCAAGCDAGGAAKGEEESAHQVPPVRRHLLRSSCQIWEIAI